MVFVSRFSFLGLQLAICIALCSALPSRHLGRHIQVARTLNHTLSSTTGLERRAEAGVSALFPIPAVNLLSWTTSPLSHPNFPLADSTFHPTRNDAQAPHTYERAPDGKLSMMAHYPKGSYTFTHKPEGGFSFYAPGPGSVDLTQAKEATFGYSVFFPTNFQFNMGGKLPGLYGGDNDQIAATCSGGSRSNQCFSARLMWRTGGAGELYTYLPPGIKANQAMCKNGPPPLTECNDTYGASVGRGSYKFATNTWTTVTQRVRLNDVGKSNGELQLWANGKSVINLGGLQLRASDSGRIRGMEVQTFFGGSEPEWASPVDQKAFFSDFSVAITEKI